MSKKILYTLPVFLLIAGLSYWRLRTVPANQQPEPTSKPNQITFDTTLWLKYEDENISFEYPPEVNVSRKDVGVMVSYQDGIEIEISRHALRSQTIQQVIDANRKGQTKLSSLKHLTEYRLAKYTYTQTLDSGNLITYDYLPYFEPEYLLIVNRSHDMDDKKYVDISKMIIASIVLQQPDPTPEPTPKIIWKKFINSNYPFTLEYPSDWKLDLTTKWDESRGISLNFKDEHAYKQIEIYIDNPRHVTFPFDSWFSQQAPDHSEYTGMTTIGGYETAKLYYNGSFNAGGPYFEFFVNHPQGVIDIWYMGDDITDVEQHILDSIVWTK